MNVSALRQLYSLCSAIPSREFALNLFYMKNGDCVHGCGLGYAAAFNLCGLHMDNEYGLPEFDDPESGFAWKGMMAASKAFSIHPQEAIDLFAGVGRSKYDPSAAFDGTYPGTHKTLWLNRMERFFAEKNLLLAAEEETVQTLDAAKKVSNHV